MVNPMTPTDLAAALIAGVKRYGLASDGGTTDEPEENEPPVLLEADVLAALTAALDGVDERAVEVVERLAPYGKKGRGSAHPQSVACREAADLITALLAQNAALREERDALAEQVAFTATDGGRLLRKGDVAGVCDSPDLCFVQESSTVRCSPCAAKIAARDGVQLNPYTHGNPQANRLRRELTAAEAKVEKLRGAAEYILDGMGIDGPEYVIDPEDEYEDAANSAWVKDVLTRLSAALTTETDNG